jgi:RNA polymerase sigma factor (sigma-70 family)
MVAFLYTCMCLVDRCHPLVVLPSPNFASRTAAVFHSSSRLLAVARASQEDIFGYEDGPIERKRRRVQRKTFSIGRPPPRSSQVGTATASATSTKRWRGSPPTRSYSLLDHEILTKKEEQKLGRQVRRALELKQKVQELQEMKELQRLERMRIERITDDDDDDDDSFPSLEEQLEEFLMRNRRKISSRSSYGHYIKDYGYDYVEGDDEEALGLSLYGFDPINKLERFDSRSVASNGLKSLEILDITLSDEEIVRGLGVPGGRKELARILVDGALAKEKLIKSNIRLVMNISKKWLAGSMTSGKDLNKMYDGSWTRPSLDEVVQEGIMGLAKAVERFEPERNLKLSTYATYYITNEVRNCFRLATTGYLKVPENYYGVRMKYQRLVKDHFRNTGRSLEIQSAADSLGMKPERLNYILTTTEPLVQLDGPAVSDLGGFANGGGGKAGSNVQGFDDLPTLAEILQWYEMIWSKNTNHYFSQRTYSLHLFHLQQGTNSRSRCRTITSASMS